MGRVIFSNSKNVTPSLTKLTFLNISHVYCFTRDTDKMIQKVNYLKKIAFKFEKKFVHEIIL